MNDFKAVVTVVLKVSASEPGTATKWAHVSIEWKVFNKFIEFQEAFSSYKHQSKYV